MKKDGSDFASEMADDFAEKMQKSLLSFSMEDLINGDLKKLYDDWTKAMKDKNGKLTKEDVDAFYKRYDDIVQEGLKRRDEGKSDRLHWFFILITDRNKRRMGIYGARYRRRAEWSLHRSTDCRRVHRSEHDYHHITDGEHRYTRNLNQWRSIGDKKHDDYDKQLPRRHREVFKAHL